jgi:predicted ATPase
VSACGCTLEHAARRIVLTGGPGAGKTAALELVRRAFCGHVHVVPEAAGILFTGGFPRGWSPEHARAAQRAIYHVQRELETIALIDRPALVLCDRGTVDGAAYWPGPEDFWLALGTTSATEWSRYDTVIHMRTPDQANGYDHANPLRHESASEARRIDDRIATAWRGHPRRIEIPSSPRFLDKAALVVEQVRQQIPACCRARDHAAAVPPLAVPPGPA